MLSPDRVFLFFGYIVVWLVAGDVLFQHCNLLHTSEPNESDMRRWAFVACYNRADNDSFLPHHHANYVKLEKASCAFVKRRILCFGQVNPGLIKIHLFYPINLLKPSHCCAHKHILRWWGLLLTVFIRPVQVLWHICKPFSHPGAGFRDQGVPELHRFQRQGVHWPHHQGRGPHALPAHRSQGINKMFCRQAQHTNGDLVYTQMTFVFQFMGLGHCCSQLGAVIIMLNAKKKDLFFVYFLWIV